MKKKKIVLIELFVSMSLFVAMIGILCIADLHRNIQKNDVVEYSAIVGNIEKNNANGKITYKISTEEYEYDLLVSEPKNQNFKFSDINNGDIIVFGVEKKYIDLLNANAPIVDELFVPIVSLKSENRTILTLNDYNQYFEDIGFEPTRICIIMIFISFVVFVKSTFTLWRMHKTGVGSVPHSDLS